MKKLTKHQKIILFPLFVVVALGLLWYPLVYNTAKYNPDDFETTIEQAIKTRDLSLCEDVKITTRPGPDDGPIEIVGQEAVDWCKQQVESGERISGG